MAGGGAGGPGGGIWYTLNQSLLLYRFYSSVLWLLNIILHRWKIAPAAAVDRDGMTAAGGGAGGRAGGAIPPYRLRGLGRYRGLVCRNFFSSFGSPRSAVLADSSRVSCCVRANRENEDK